MGKIVSSEYNGTAMTNNSTTIADKDSSTGSGSNVRNAAMNNEDGWTPRPGYLAKRKFVATPSGWFPVDDGFGAREFGWIGNSSRVCCVVCHIAFRIVQKNHIHFF